MSARKRKRAPRSAEKEGSTPAQAKAAESATEQRPRRSPLRLWAFRLTALIGIPTLLLLLLELSLRIFGFGYPTDFAIKTQVGGRPMYAQNRKFFWRFFPPDVARTPVPFAIPAVKPPETCRIFVLGASAAVGVPDHTFSFGRILEAQLRQRYPGVTFEVVNTAAVAINSHVVLKIARDCADLDPDLFVVYLGNNEVVGPFGAGTVFAPVSPSRWAIHAGLRLKTTRVGQLLQKLPTMFSDSAAPRAWTGLSMFLEKQVPADAPDLETVYGHFRDNLVDMCRLAEERGIPLVLCTVATNLRDCPPFASLHRPDLTDAEATTWEATYAEALSAESQGRFQAAAERYRSAAQIDDRYAELHFRLGRCHWTLGDHAAARECFVAARDLDTLRFRADSRINAIIQSAVSQGDFTGVVLVDAERALVERSPHSTPGQELFHEHVHLTFAGNYALATVVRGALESLLPDWVKQKARADAPPLNEQRCADLLAYTDWDRYRVTRKMFNTYITAPPFNNQPYHQERLDRFEKHLEELKSRLTPEALAAIDAEYRAAIRKNPSDVWLHLNYSTFLLSGTRNPTAAEEHVRAVLRIFPQYPDALDKLTRILAWRGKLDEAEAVARQVLEVSPNRAAALSRLGHVPRAQGKLDQAIGCFQEALQLAPGFAGAQRGLTDALLAQGRTDQALDVHDRTLPGEPDSAEAHYRLAMALSETDRLDEVLAHLREAVRLRPDWAAPAANLAWALATAPSAAIRNGPEAVRLAERLCQATGYNDPQLLDVLAAACAEAGRFSDAVAVAGKALSLTTPGTKVPTAERRRRVELYRQGRPYRTQVRPRSRP